MPPLQVSDEQPKSPESNSHCTTLSDQENGSCSEQDSGSPQQKSKFLKFAPDLSPQKPAKKQRNKKSNSYKVNGVNILNRKSIDSKTVVDRLKKRRENHNHVERKRRDNINHTILEISQLVPMETTTSTKLNKGNILRIAAEYIKELQTENSLLKSQLANYNDRMYTYSGVQASPVSTHPTDGPSYTESQHREIANKYSSEIIIKTENSGYYNPSEVLPNVTHLTIPNGEYGYSCYQYQRLPSRQPSVSLPVTSLPLPSIIQSSEHASLSLPKLSQSNLGTYSRPTHAFGSPSNPPYHPMQHRGLMLTDHYNTLNLF